MDANTYNELLLQTTLLIKKQNMVMRESISPNERLSATLRFLATGQSFEDLKFLTNISAQALGRIIIETCKAICSALKPFINIGFIFIFNLIVGTGALTLPAAFAKSGWLLSTFVLVSLAAIGYITTTFVIETIACANAVRSWQNLQFNEGSAEESGNEDDQLLGNSNQNSIREVFYRLDTKFELGEMVALFFNDVGRMVFYLCLVIYLYGDISIYAAAVAKTLRDIACVAQNSTQSTTVDSDLRMSLSFHDDGEDITCWSGHSLTRMNVYRIFLIFFFVLLGPFTFAQSAQKTKYLQILTVIFRWTAFLLMISLAIKFIISDGVKGHPITANYYAVPPLFGACVYSFMCHHSLPSLIAPIDKKKKLHSLLLADYTLICLFYILLAISGIFAFSHIEDLYTLNFIPSTGSSRTLIIIDYFLALFPVLTLSTSFPIVSITLRNNLQTLFLDVTRLEAYNFFLRRLLFPFLAIFPPFVVTYYTQNLTSLVAFTGSYAGNAIQYLIPVSLVYFGRRTCKDLLGSGVVNEFRSSFQSFIWIPVVIIWSMLCMFLVTLNFFQQ